MAETRQERAQETDASARSFGQTLDAAHGHPPVYPVLACRGVSVRFGGVQALSEVEFAVAEGVVAALIGPNGAGKTTLLNVLSGVVRPTEGSVRLRDQDVSRAPAHERGRLGVIRTFQNLEIFSSMTVLENVMAGCHRLGGCSILDSALRTPRWRATERRYREMAEEALEFVGLAGEGSASASELPYGKLRLLEIARAVVSRPAVLLLDEPAAGLNIRETRELGQVIRRIRSELGVSVVLVEHDMDLVMGVSDRVTALCFGRVIAEGTPAEIQKNPEVVAAYLGGDDDDDPWLAGMGKG